MTNLKKKIKPFFYETKNIPISKKVIFIYFELLNLNSTSKFFYHPLVIRKSVPT